ncbi:CAMK family protein kinase [Trichomonas vaginalis G3]|uniref:non-specific serine/threonine protein kinase n=1 Tax=Trichomonas vaginalis (strain ATCC PRA-98 / G3) TaxID=412133 RepID=A2FCZ8_TRIV3|nr:protein kinase related family [Trichomonas vaginalis G3]EAX97236.1 CAMK family protein kinase [Trichomonas vaginalis G3]KAI5509541.1 protein kinase related family [Trichomonas vaginalis G3]|eukprot:XP_001310166.1 CAMK family protein kinase [Trichomonas vaginalis G3]
MNDYYQIAQIGEGSFGRVYKARRKYTGRLVAIKMIHKLGQSQDSLASLRREINILQKVDHPNIMRLLEVFETNTDVCLVTELGRGDLFQVIQDQQTLPESVLKSVAAQLVSALLYLHQQRIIHRDIKPQNVLISLNNTVKLCDFGFARALSNTTLVLNSIKGTPLYMAPELVQEQQYNEKVDIWSLGAILYELYYGKTPFSAKSIYKLIQMIVNDQIAWSEPISPEFKGFLSIMLQKNPDRRASCEDLVKHPFIKGVPIDTSEDEFYRYKKEQFSAAIAKSQLENYGNNKDFQSVFINPSSYSDEEVINALNYLYENNPPYESPFASSFSYKFKDFISRPKCVEISLKCAEMFLSKNREKCIQSFISGIDLLNESNIPRSAIDFYTQLLLIPFSQKSIESGSDQAIREVGDILTDKNSAEKMMNQLLSFLFTSDAVEFSKLYSMMAFLAQTSDTFLTVISISLSEQVIPIIISHITQKNITNVSAAGFSILSKILMKNNNVIQLIQSFNQLINTLLNSISQAPTSIETFCLFSCAFSFLRITFPALSQMGEFQHIVPKREDLANVTTFLNAFYQNSNIDSSVLLKSLLQFASVQPTKLLEILAYVPVHTSPFVNFPVKPSDVDTCMDSLDNVLPMHANGVVDCMFSSSSRINIEKLSKLFDRDNWIEKASKFVLDSLDSGADANQLMTSLFEHNILTSLTKGIEKSTSNPPFYVAALLVRCVLAIRSDSAIQPDKVGDVLKVAYSSRAMAEAGVIISAHLARTHPRFVAQIQQQDGLKFLERMTLSIDNPVRSRALSAIGNIAKGNTLEPQYITKVVPNIISAFSITDIEVRRFALYALANIVYVYPKTALEFPMMIEEILPAFNVDDIKTREFAGTLVCNIFRSDEGLAKKMIENGLAKLTVKLLEGKDDLACRMIPRISMFCKYEDGRKFLKIRGVRSLISKMTNVKVESAKTIATKMLSIIDA